MRNSGLTPLCATFRELSTSPLKNADFEAFWRINGGHIWTLGRGARVGLPYMGVENRLFTTLLSQKNNEEQWIHFRFRIVPAVAGIVGLLIEKTFQRWIDGVAVKSRGSKVR